MKATVDELRAKVDTLSDAVVKLTNLLAEEKQVNMNLCAIIAKLEEKHGK